MATACSSPSSRPGGRLTEDRETWLDLLGRAGVELPGGRLGISETDLDAVLVGWSTREGRMLAPVVNDDLVHAARQGFAHRIEASLGTAVRRMEAEGVSRHTAEDIATELAHGAGSAFLFVAVAAQDAGRDIREFLEQEGENADR